MSDILALENKAANTFPGSVYRGGCTHRSNRVIYSGGKLYIIRPTETTDDIGSGFYTVGGGDEWTVFTSDLPLQRTKHTPPWSVYTVSDNILYSAENFEHANLCMYDTQSGVLIKTVKHKMTGGPFNSPESISCDNTHLVIANHKECYVYNKKTLEEIKHYRDGEMWDWRTFRISGDWIYALSDPSKGEPTSPYTIYSLNWKTGEKRREDVLIAKDDYKVDVIDMCVVGTRKILLIEKEVSAWTFEWGIAIVNKSNVGFTGISYKPYCVTYEDGIIYIVSSEKDSTSVISYGVVCVL